MAPPAGAVPNSTPGRHGGNLDCADVRGGAVVHLPVTVPGGLFACGDIHALQADGEVAGMGVEVAGEVLARLELQPRIISPWPVVEQTGHYAVLTAARTLDEAADLAVAAARDLLSDQLGVDDAEGTDAAEHALRPARQPDRRSAQGRSDVPPEDAAAAVAVLTPGTPDTAVGPANRPTNQGDSYAG